jgi:tryptophanyl-tRNA synthetase
VGLLTYPVLQAADILLYQADAVPVGEDQRQHLELARDIAQRFNNRFGETFVVPKGTYPEIGAMVMDLQDPTWRMSTSAESDAGVVRLLDPPDVIRRKIRSAVTDSGREVVRSPEKPGVTNLIEILSATTGEAPDAVEARYDAQGYGGFKADVAEAVVDLVGPIQARFAELRGDPGELRAILAKGAGKAHAVAARTLELAYERVGFVQP